MRVRDLAPLKLQNLRPAFLMEVLGYKFETTLDRFFELRPVANDLEDLANTEIENSIDLDVELSAEQAALYQLTSAERLALCRILSMLSHADALARVTNGALLAELLTYCGSSELLAILPRVKLEPLEGLDRLDIVDVPGLLSLEPVFKLLLISRMPQSLLARLNAQRDFEPVPDEAATLPIGPDDLVGAYVTQGLVILESMQISLDRNRKIEPSSSTGDGKQVDA